MNELKMPAGFVMQSRIVNDAVTDICIATQTDKDKNFYERYSESLDAQIDELTFDFYGLSVDERKAVKEIFINCQFDKLEIKAAEKDKAKLNSATPFPAFYFLYLCLLSSVLLTTELLNLIDNLRNRRWTEVVYKLCHHGS